jgi:mevalonate kinase
MAAFASSLSVETSAPGKVILFGEHAVVHGSAAISAALSELRIYVKLQLSIPNHAEITTTDGSLRATFDDFLDENGNPTVIHRSIQSLPLRSLNSLG